VHVVEIVERDDEELHVPDDVLEDRKKQAARGSKCCLENKNYVIILFYERMKTSEWKTVSESEVNERETFTHW
jgi:hypothetical protein